MKNYTRIACVFLAIVMILSLASCSLTKQYSYKTDDAELPIGVYIYNLYSAYNSAQSFAQQSDLYDSEAKTYDGKKSFLKMEITDDDGKKATADEWIIEKADEYTRELLAIYKEFNELGCTIDEATVTEYKNAAQEYWDYGPYYQYYGEQYKNPYSEIFEPLGVSFDSFYIATYYSSAMQKSVFDALYGKNGVEAVSDEDLTDFFTENYTSYKYFSTNLYTTESRATLDEEGNDTTEDVNVAFSEEEAAKYVKSFEGYASEISSGKKYDDVTAKYMEDYSVDSDPTQSGVEVMSDSSISEDIADAIKELDEGKAKAFTVGEGDNAVEYLAYVEPIADQIENYIKDDTNRETVLKKMKDDDLTDLLKKIAGEIEPSVSSACKSCKPSMFEK